MAGGSNPLTADGTVHDETAAWGVMVVESNADDREPRASGLRRRGHEVAGVETGGAALRACEDADFILLDLELPDLDGLEVCRGIRARSNVPMIAVTGWGTELDRVLGLQAGADDYVVKPYGFRELMARMDAVMRRVHPHQPATQPVSHGSLHIDVESRLVSVRDRRVELTRKEFDLLYLLASRPGTVVSRKQIMQQVWGDSW